MNVDGVITENNEEIENCQHPRKMKSNSEKGYYFQRCGSSNEFFCSYCSRLYRRDKNIIISSGCEVSKFEEDSELITEDILKNYDFFTLTVTAPSFGKVYGKNDGSELSGTPVKMDNYNFKGQILWNANSGNLFHHSIKYLKDAFNGDFEFCVVREWQERGVIHFHILFRVLKSDNVDNDFKVLLNRFKTYKYKSFKWGQQSKILQVSMDKLPSIVSYFSKALTEDVRQHGVEYKLLSDVTRKFYNKLDFVAYKNLCKCGESFTDCTCKNVRAFGFSGHMLSSSKNWSFTGVNVSLLKDRRKKWVDANKHTFEKSTSVDVNYMEAKYNENMVRYSQVIGSKEVADSRVNDLLYKYADIFK